MAENPKYVRLNDRAARGMRADVKGSGWSISGKDVLPFPKRSGEAKYVRRLLNKGILEAASLAEYEEAHADDGEVSESPVGHQEHRVHERAAKRADAAAEARAAASESETSDDDDDGEYDDDTDDEDEDDGSDALAAEEALAEAAAENAAAASAAAKKPAKAKKAVAKKGTRSK